MLKVIGAIVVAAGMAAQPALARDGAASSPGGTAPLLTIVTDSGLDLGARNDDGAAASPFRLVTQLPFMTAGAGRADKAAGMLRRHGAMIDLFPVAGSGFHLSGGTRFFTRRNFLAETEASARGAMAGPKAIAGATTYRAGFKRFNPALTAGYTMAVSKAAQVGIEAGALMSSAYTGTPGLARRAIGYRNEHEFRPDAIVNLAFGMRF